MTTTSHRIRQTASQSRPRWGDLVEVKATDRDRYAAARVALTVFGPSLALLVIGREDLLLFAVFAGFMGVYGRNHSHRARLRLQCAAGGAQLSSLALGAAIGLSSHREVLLVIAATIWAGLWSVVGGIQRWAPPGPMFQIFALGATASMPMTGHLMAQGMVVAVAACLWCLLINAAERLLWLPSSRREHNPFTRPARQGPPPAHGVAWTAVLYAAVTFVAGAVPTVLGIGHAYWAMITALAVMAVPTAAARLGRGLQRLAGTVIGIGLGWLLLATHPSALVALVLVACLQFCIEMYILRNYAIASIFITPLVIVMASMAHNTTENELLFERALQTLIGCGIGFAATVIVAFLLTHDRSTPEATAQVAGS